MIADLSSLGVCTCNRIFSKILDREVITISKKLVVNRQFEPIYKERPFAYATTTIC